MDIFPPLTPIMGQTLFDPLWPLCSLAKVGILMRQERYAEAIPLIKLLSDSAQHIYERRFYTRMLIDAAEKAGDLETKRNAEVRNSSVLEEFMKFKTSQRIHELQLLYDVNALRRHTTASRITALLTPSSAACAPNVFVLPTFLFVLVRNLE